MRELKAIGNSTEKSARTNYNITISTGDVKDGGTDQVLNLFILIGPY